MSKSGVILVILGCVFLAHNFDLLQWGWVRQWWPLILIGVGIWSIIERRPNGRRPSQGTDKQP